MIVINIIEYSKFKFDLELFNRNIVTGIEKMNYLWNFLFLFYSTMIVTTEKTLNLTFTTIPNVSIFSTALDLCGPYILNPTGASKFRF